MIMRSDTAGRTPTVTVVLAPSGALALNVVCTLGRTWKVQVPPVPVRALPTVVNAVRRSPFSEPWTRR